MPVKQIGKAISFFAIAGEQLCPDSSRVELCWVSLCSCNQDVFRIIKKVMEEVTSVEKSTQR